jgi:PAS domain S-box-containing protein
MIDATETRIQGLGRRYVAVLLVVAGLLLLDQAVLQPLLVRLNLYAPVINLAGRQRMLSQRLVKASLAMARNDADDAKWRMELEESLQTWVRVHNGLQKGDPELDLPGASSPAIQHAFAQLEPHYAALSGSVAGLLDSSIPPETAIESLLEHEGAYLTTMDRIVRMFEGEARSRVTQLRRLGMLATAAVLGFMAGLYGLVLKPATGLIRRQVHQLAESEARFRQLIERMHDGLVVLTPAGRITYANDRASQILGRRRDELISQPLAVFTRDHHRERLLSLLKPAPDGRCDASEIEWALPGHATCHTLVAPGFSRDQTDKDLVLFLVLTDITPQKLAEEVLRDSRDRLEVRVAERTQELTQANAALGRAAVEQQAAEERNRQLQDQLAHAARVTSLGQLATGIAHEINQPLGAIANYAEALQIMAGDRNGSTTELQATAQRLRDSALRAGQIVSRMRNFLRQKPTPRSLVKINDLVEDVLMLCESESRQNDVVVLRDLSETQDALVNVDPIQIQQVLMNVVRNAVQAMLRNDIGHRQLTIRTSGADGVVVVDVEDSGPGFPAEFLSANFNAFKTSKEDGLGMGLSISQSLVAAHKGDLAVENLPSGGARVSFYLPGADPTEHAQLSDCLCRG